MGKRVANRVLLLGWDAADWQIINKLMDAGEMPHLEKLINQGVMGNLATLQPVLSPMLWSSVCTGKRADKHGIFGFIEPKPDGSGVRPVTSTSLRAQPLWNIIEDHGLKSAVVGWFATHPANALKGTVVSNHFHPPTGAGFDDWPVPENAISPESLKAELEDLRVHPNDLSVEQILSFIPDAGDIDQEGDDRLNNVIKLIAQCFTVHASGTYLAEHGDWDLLAVYYDTIDRVCHEVMECRAPQMPHVSNEDFARYQGVVDQVYRFHDMMLGRYMSLVGPETTIMLISDHGFFSDHLRPQGEIGAAKREPVRWHRDYGIFVASGPGIKKDELTFGASLLDIAPTTLALLGLPTAKDMEGRVLTQIFEHPYEIEYVDSYGEPNCAEDGSPEEDPWAAQQLMEQFIALGYVEDSSEDDAAEAIEKAILQKLSNLSQVHLSVNEYSKAVEVLEELMKRRPNDLRCKLWMAQCRLNLGDLEACRETVNEILNGKPNSPWGNLLAGMLCSAENETDKALQHFKQAETSGPNMPNLHTRIGQIHLQIKNWSEAEISFRNALEIDGDSAGAFRGLGISQYHQKYYDQAVENLLRSVALLHHQPMAHFHLGLALMASGKLNDAIRVLNIALEMKPDLDLAHNALAKIYDQKDEESMALLHRSKVRMKNNEASAVN